MEKNSKSRILITIDAEKLKKFDEIIGLVPRSAAIEDLIKKYIENKERGETKD